MLISAVITILEDFGSLLSARTVTVKLSYLLKNIESVKGKGSGSFIRPPKGICLTPQGGIWAVDKGRVVVYDKDYHSLEPIRINAAAKPACLTATHEGQIAMVNFQLNIS